MADGEKLDLDENGGERAVDLNENEGKSTNKRKRAQTVLREASPACDYEKIRAANMELFGTLDVRAAVAKA